MAKEEKNILTPEIAKKQDQIVQSVVGNKTLQGFQKAHLVSSAIVQLREMMTTEYMAPIMALQGNRIGFKTDKDIVKDPSSGKYVKGQGYPMEVVRECVIEATLKGLQVTGNEFNIIGGNTYPTLEGMRSLLRQIPNFAYKVKTGIPEVNDNKTLATFKKVDISWTLNSKEDHQEFVEIQIKIDAYASVDSMIGKAKRKAYAWLYETVTGEEISDGEVEDIPHTEVSSEPIQIANTALPSFTKEHFEKAKKANATVEKIRERYTLSEDVEKEYLEYVSASEK